MNGHQGLVFEEQVGSIQMETKQSALDSKFPSRRDKNCPPLCGLLSMSIHEKKGEH